MISPSTFRMACTAAALATFFVGVAGMILSFLVLVVFGGWGIIAGAAGFVAGAILAAGGLVSTSILAASAPEGGAKATRASEFE